MEIIEDVFGNSFELRDSTVEHIRSEHRIIDPIAFVSDVLGVPDAIFESNWEADT